MSAGDIWFVKKEHQFDCTYVCVCLCVSGCVCVRVSMCPVTDW